MKITKTKKWGRFTSVMILGVALLVTSCIKDDAVITPVVGSSENLTLVLNIPNNGKIQKTRAIPEGGEYDNQVKEIDVVLFDHSSGKYVKIVPGNSIEDVESGVLNRKKFSISVLKGTWDMLILANSRSIIDSKLAPSTNHTLLQTKSMADIEKLLVLENTSKWNADPSDTGYKPFPMWGKKFNITVPTSDSKITGIDMIRMVSKINLRFSSKAVSDKFTLEEVRLCNYDTKGYVTSPDWKSGAIEVEDQALNPYANGSLVKDYTGLSYTAFADITNPDSPSEQVQAITDEIFLFETVKPTSTSEWIGATCLLIKGKFKDDDSERWFRINIRELNNGVWEHLNLVRNYRYEVVINDIKGRGHDDDETAYNSLPEGLEIGIVVWNDAGLADYATDGQYLLGVSQNEFEFYKDKEVGNVFYIYTDYTDDVTKMSVTPSYPENTDTGWITNGTLVRDATGDTSDKRFCFKYTFDCEENAGDVREATLKVNAKGRLVVPVHIKQLDYSASFLTAESDGKEIEELIFSAGADVQPAAQIYTVKWSPKSETLYTSATQVTKPGVGAGVFSDITWSKYDAKIGTSNPVTDHFVYQTPITDGSGVVEFTIQPEAIKETDMDGDPFYERQTQVNFRANSPMGTQRKTVLLQQVVEKAQVEIDPFYLADGSQYYFTVKSNRPWRAFLTGNGDGIITTPVSETNELQTGGYNLPDGGKVYFTTYDDLSNLSIFTGTGTVNVQYLSSDGVTWVDVKQNNDKQLPIFCASGIIQPYSNTYLLKPGAYSVPILIPVNRANGYMSEGVRGVNWEAMMGENANPIAGPYTTEVVWTDTPHSTSPVECLGENGAVRRLAAAGKDANGYILVQAGKNPGNTVISIKDANGKIAWSWHIWVSDYEPYNADGTIKDSETWMTRNLGATDWKLTSDATAFPPSYGNYYQWGRSVPFPGAGQAKNNVLRYYYTPGSASGTNAMPTWSTGGRVATNKFANPLILYSDWAGSDNAVFKYDYQWGGSNTEGGASWGTNQTRISGKGDKTLYDPCPEGYQVPIFIDKTYKQSPYYWGNEQSYFTGPDDIWGGKEDYGVKITGKGEYYPAAGSIPTGTQSPINVGQRGWYLGGTPRQSAASPTSLRGFFITMDIGNLDVSHITPSNAAGALRTDGVPVRCVKIH